MTDLTQALADDTGTRDLYGSYYPVEGEPQFDGDTIDIYGCAILNLTSPEFDRCNFGEERQAPRACRSSGGRDHRLQFQ